MLGCSSPRGGEKPRTVCPIALCGDDVPHEGSQREVTRAQSFCEGRAMRLESSSYV
jgi:hypothetical protein